MTSDTLDPALFNVFDPAIKPDPHRVYRQFRSIGPVIQNPMLGFWMVTGYDECVQILRDTQTFSSARIGVDPVRDFLNAPTMLFSDPPDHERLRGPVQKAFTPRSVAALEPRVREIARELLAGLQSGRAFDVVAALAYPLPVIVIAEMMGIPAEDRADFKRWSDAAVGFNALGSGEEVRTAELDELRDYLSDVIAQRRRQPGDDLVTRLVAANEDGALADDELLASCVLLLVAGNETTANLITNGVLTLAKFPDQRHALVNAPEKIPAAVEELLRFDGTVQSTFRSVTRDVVVGDQTLTEGSLVLVMLAAANRDPRQFPEPDAFEVGRENARLHLGLGFGVHHCIGAAAARLETKVALETLLALAPAYELAEPDAPPVYGPNFFLRGITSLSIMPSR